MPSLAQLLGAASAQGAPFEPRVACAIAARVCDQLGPPLGALDPSTISVGWDGAVTVTRAAHPPGPAAIDELRAVGLVLFEMVTGRPWVAGAPGGGSLQGGELPIELGPILERAMARDPLERYATPRDMAAWLSLAEEESGGVMSPADLAGWMMGRFAAQLPSGARSRPRRRWPVATTGIAACAGVLVAFAAFAEPGLIGSPGEAGVSERIGSAPDVPTRAQRVTIEALPVAEGLTERTPAVMPLVGAAADDAAQATTAPAAEAGLADDAAQARRAARPERRRRDRAARSDAPRARSAADRKGKACPMAAKGSPAQGSMPASPGESGGS